MTHLTFHFDKHTKTDYFYLQMQVIIKSNQFNCFSSFYS